ncbi:MAG: tetratricopeptide repeat protein [Thermonemataceae bacterium]|nr:tetratricopeptide repeat protein [Thermonemataceae bacterium]
MKQTLVLLFFLLAQTSFGQKKYKEALSNARTQILKKEYAQALPYLEKVIQLKPKVAENYYLKGLCHFEQEQYTEAIKSFSLATEKDASKWLYFKKKADAEYNSEAYQEAEQSYTKALDLEKTKKNDTLYQYRGDCFLKMKKYTEAIRDYDKAIELNDKNPQIFYDRAYMHVQLQHSEQACSDYQKAHELGFKKAEKEAYELLKCKWAKKAYPKDNTFIEVSKVETEIFTGAIVVSKGLIYKKLEVSSEKNNSYITQAVFAFGDEFIIKVDSPQGFRTDEEGKIHIGAGFSVLENDKVLGSVEDLFGESAEGIEPTYLKNLKLTLKFSPPLEKGKKYLLKARFFDKLSNAEITWDMPFVMADKTSESNSINSSVAVLGNNVETKSTKNIKFGDLEVFHQNNKLKDKILSKDNFYTIILKNKENLGSNVLYQYKWVDARTGLVSSEKTGETLAQGKGMQINLAVQSPQKVGKYILWLSLVDKQNAEKIWTMSSVWEIE